MSSFLLFSLLFPVLLKGIIRTGFRFNTSQPNDFDGDTLDCDEGRGKLNRYDTHILM